MKTKIIGGLALAAALCLGLSGCVTNEKVAVSQIGDDGLGCSEIMAQTAKLDELSDQARHNKGVNTANVAAVLLFWPAAVGNYMDSDHAEQLIEKRRTKLAEFYAEKHCSAASGKPAAHR